MIKKIYALVVALVLALIPLTFSFDVGFAGSESGYGQTVEQQFDETINEQLENLDLSGLNKFFDEYCTDALGIFANTSLIDKIKQIINGDFGADTGTILEGLANVFLSEIISFLPLISSIIAIAVLASILTQLQSKDSSVGDIIHFVCFGVIVVIIMCTIHLRVPKQGATIVFVVGLHSAIVGRVELFAFTVSLQ